MSAIVSTGRDEGVYYRREDYAGVWRRTLVSTVDAVVALVGLLVLLLIGDASPLRSGPAWAFVAWVVLSYLYFVSCKRSAARTLGYRLGRVRLVSIHGDSPSVWRVTYRLLLALMGGGYSSVLGLIDISWIAADEDRQTLHDKLAQTYVIRASAEPMGRGRIGYDVYHVLAWTLLVAGVRRRSPSEDRTPTIDRA